MPMCKPMRIDNEYLDKKFSFLLKYLKASIHSGNYQGMVFLETYGFWLHVKYVGDNWHYTIDETKELQDREIEWLKICSKVGPSPTMKITMEDYNYIKEFYI